MEWRLLFYEWQQPPTPSFHAFLAIAGNVQVTVFGLTGDTGAQTLDTSRNNFERVRAVIHSRAAVQKGDMLWRKASVYAALF